MNALTPEAVARLAELVAPLTAEIEYPERDGKPMAETDVHRDLMTEALIHPLKEWFRDRPDVYVSGNLLLYYEEGNPKACVAPDAFVVFGVSNEQRRIYKLWEEESVPAVVFELTSRSTRQEDLRDKRLLYEELGMHEYFLFDPLREYLEPPLRGFRLVDDYFAPVSPEPFGDGEWQLQSEILQLTLRTEGSALRLFDPAAGRYLLTSPEEAEARRDAEARAAGETEARRQAEARLAELEAELAHLRAAQNTG